MSVHRKYHLTLFLLAQILVLQILGFFPEFVERIYSNGFYVFISKISRLTLGNIPLSIGDVLYLIVIFFILKWMLKKRKTWKLHWKDNLLSMINAFAIFYFLFHLMWATNYYRLPLFEKMDIKREYNDADLLKFTKKLIAKTNEIHGRLALNDSVKIVFPYTQEQVFTFNQLGYDNLAKQYPYFHYEHRSVKKSLLSMPLTYMGFSGYLNPFTNEAQVNDMIPMYSFPATTTHEMAHQLGYASESEANFIGFLAAIKNENVYLQYSGYTMALRYCLRNWEIRDKKVLKQLMPTIHLGVVKNYRDAEAFWKQYESFVETGFKVFYDHFLKFNQQKDGIESYSKFVNLLVNYYKERDFE